MSQMTIALIILAVFITHDLVNLRMRLEHDIRDERVKKD